MKKRIISWGRKKLIIFLGIDQEISRLYREINSLRHIIKERTEYHLDVHNYAKHNSHVILIGKFRRHDFVKCYNIPDESFSDLIHQCKDLEKYARMGKVDTIPEISAAVKNAIQF